MCPMRSLCIDGAQSQTRFTKTLLKGCHRIYLSIVTSQKDILHKDTDNFSPHIHCLIMNLSKLPPHLPNLPIKIAVDNFKVQDADIHFLTHFHADHYMGLKKSFTKPIYCSRITADLIQLQYKIPSCYLHILEHGVNEINLQQFNLEVKPEFNEITIETMDANHCPGALVLSFSYGDVNILHTGDFRFNETIKNFITRKSFNVAFVDNTYLKSRLTFPTQDDVLHDLSIHLDKMERKQEGILRWFKPLKSVSTTILYVFGTYTVGKEMVPLQAAQVLDTKMFSPDTKRLKILNIAFRGNADEELLSTTPMDSRVHVLSIRKLKHDLLEDYLKSNNSLLGRKRYDKVVAFKCTGWSLARSLKDKDENLWKEWKRRGKTRGKVTIYNIPYSEHSSHKELEDFLSCLSANKIYWICG